MCPATAGPPPRRQPHHIHTHTCRTTCQHVIDTNRSHHPRPLPPLIPAKRQPSEKIVDVASQFSIRKRRGVQAFGAQLVK